jgi:hypothetical protein
VLFGLVLIGVGVAIALEQAGIAGNIIGAWWPTVVIVAGAMQVAAAPRAPGGALLTIGIGAFLLAWTTGLLSTDLARYVWPLALVAAGAWILLTRTGQAATVAADPANRIQAWALFSGREIASHARPLRSASLTAVFGGISLDLRNAEVPPEGIDIAATAAFGGVDITIPAGWRVEMTGPVIFGGYEDKTRGAPADGPLLRVHCLVLFGGTEVRS